MIAARDERNMTIDERLQFLVQSTESLHASAQELHSGVIGMREAIVELREIAAEHTRQLQIDAENIRSLANIAAAHEQRLDNLGGR
jgi:predicted metal-dependent hydrolase